MSAPIDPNNANRFKPDLDPTRKKKYFDEVQNAVKPVCPECKGSGHHHGIDGAGQWMCGVCLGTGNVEGVEPAISDELHPSNFCLDPFHKTSRESINTDAELTKLFSSLASAEFFVTDGVLYAHIAGPVDGLGQHYDPSNININREILAYTRRYHVVGLRELKEQTLELRDFQNESISICGLIQDVGAAIEKAIEAEEKKLV